MGGLIQPRNALKFTFSDFVVRRIGTCVEDFCDGIRMHFTADTRLRWVSGSRVPPLKNLFKIEASIQKQKSRRKSTRYDDPGRV
jgi:hypothetical protein